MTTLASADLVPPGTQAGSVACALSVVIPAYNEAERIGPTLQTVRHYLRSTGVDFEILVVDDGSRDGTESVARKLAETMPELKVLGYGRNRGKGFAVRTGMLQARGRLLLFSDADLSTPIEELTLLERAIDDGAQVAIASRHLGRSRIVLKQPLHRRYLGRVFNSILSLIAIRGIADTQCGFKLFRAAAARRIFSRLKTEGFAFDVEVLMLARRFGYRIDEIPVRWANSSASRVRPVRDSLRMLQEILKMRGVL